MKNDNVHDFFHNVSRLTIILPIIIIGLAIILKPRAPEIPRTKNVLYAVTPTITPVVTLVKSQTRTPINLQGPLTCAFNSQVNYQGMIYIKNKHVRADVVTSSSSSATISAVLSGDCLYKWEQKSVTGVKMCGLSQYVAILDTMANFGALDAQTLMSLVTQFGNANGATNMPKNVPETVCKKDTVSDGVFDIPKTIRFQVRTATPSATNR